MISINDGLETEGGRGLLAKLKCAMRDAPARSMVKSTESFGGYHGCEKCAKNYMLIRKLLTLSYAQMRHCVHYRVAKSLKNHGKIMEF